eukprot:3216931-Rhodomonas_salina.1
MKQQFGSNELSISWWSGVPAKLSAKMSGVGRNLLVVQMYNRQRQYQITARERMAGAVGAAVKGQEALHSFLMSWQEALSHMSTRHADVPAATEQLRALRE